MHGHPRRVPQRGRRDRLLLRVGEEPLGHVRFGRMQKRFEQSATRRLLAGGGERDRHGSSRRRRSRRSPRAPSEEDLVNSGLEETMIGAYHPIREVWKRHAGQGGHAHGGLDRRDRQGGDELRAVGDLSVGREYVWRKCVSSRAKRGIFSAVGSSRSLVASLLGMTLLPSPSAAYRHTNRGRFRIGSKFGSIRKSPADLRPGSEASASRRSSAPSG